MVILGTDPTSRVRFPASLTIQEEADQASLERQVSLSWCVSPGAGGDHRPALRPIMGHGLRAVLALLRDRGLLLDVLVLLVVDSRPTTSRRSPTARQLPYHAGR